ncbi:MAG: carboxylate--amine ligase [Chloroflexi bacterium]|nr:carboxylate--amine ligase [Chloroflexota bacterium]
MLDCAVFLPDHETIMLCEDNAASNAVWHAAGVAVPRSMRIDDQRDLEKAFGNYGEKIWLRAVVGSGASGALPVSDMESAVSWINLNKGWGRFMAAELLGPQTVSWESVWSNGELVVAQSRRRLYWEFGRIAMSGVSGIAGAGEAVADPEIDRVALAAVQAVAERPHGVLGVDIAYDMDGTPKITEINAGRFMSGASCHFATRYFNVPYAAVQAAFGEDGGFQRPLLNPVTPGTIFVSGLDRVPVFTTRKEIEQRKASLESMVKQASEACETV